MKEDIMAKRKSIRNWVAKNSKHKGGRHKSKKDYDRKSLRKRLKDFIKNWRDQYKGYYDWLPTSRYQFDSDIPLHN